MKKIISVVQIGFFFFYNRLSVTGNYSLRINLGDFDGNQRYAEYKNFKVDDEKVINK